MKELYRTNSEVKSRYEAKPSQHEKFDVSPDAKRKKATIEKSKSTAVSSTSSVGRKAALDRIDRLVPKQTHAKNTTKTSTETPVKKPLRKIA